MILHHHHHQHHHHNCCENFISCVHKLVNWIKGGVILLFVYKKGDTDRFQQVLGHITIITYMQNFI